ncbi:glycosyltransferase [Brachyspira intermedia]|uniref:glycosyltransferase n=1 Tax=Brachyspira intermedia TaxID=84377 RepID=UPI0030051540
MEKNIKITVITPTYNRANFLPKTIESILNQSYTNFEYYILDDGSTDNTKEVVGAYLKDKRVKYLYHENVGEPETVNWGWSLAKGEYFVQINSDDTIFNNLFEEMVLALDQNPDKILAYPDFNYLKDDKIIYTVRNEKWDFAYFLSGFGCPAAAVGTFIRKTALKDWQYLRSKKYKHINDIVTYWNMALVGDFIYVPIVSGNWTIHNGQISTNRYEAIKEIEIWFNEYFSRNDLPENILNIKNNVRQSILVYYISLLKEEPSINISKKIDMIKEYKKELDFQFTNLQISNNDLIGNKFNGHDLHFYLRERKIDSIQIVKNKESNDRYTFNIFSRNLICIQEILEKAYNIQNLSYYATYDILYSKFFIYSDIIHLHLISCQMFNLNLLPLMSKLKPIVWTLHDPWLLGGHCAYPIKCDKWQNQCEDCEHLDTIFELDKDTTALNFEIKRDIIERSDISFIVASKWMERLAKKSPMCKDKDIYYVPFGIDQNIFKPEDMHKVRKELEIDNDAFVIMFRACHIPYKGVDIIKKCLEKISTNKKIVVITVESKSMIDEFKDKFKIIDFGWVKDDILLAKLYQSCNIFLMPSRREAFGMMAIEAMSCGKMVLGLEDTSLKEIINAPECGIVCKEEEYPNKLQYLIDNPDEIREREKKSLEFAKKNYAKDVYVDRMIEVYKQIMSKHKLESKYEAILDQLDKYVSNNKFVYDRNTYLDEVSVLENIKKCISYNENVNNYKYFKIKLFGIQITIKYDKIKKFLTNN